MHAHCKKNEAEMKPNLVNRGLMEALNIEVKHDKIRTIYLRGMVAQLITIFICIYRTYLYVEKYENSFELCLCNNERELDYVGGFMKTPIHMQMIRNACNIRLFMSRVYFHDASTLYLAIISVRGSALHSNSLGNMQKEKRLVKKRRIIVTQNTKQKRFRLKGTEIS